MLCASCFTPLSPWASSSFACPRCGQPAGQRTAGRSYSLAMAATVLRSDTQPELPIDPSSRSSSLSQSPSTSASRYETVRLWADSLIRGGSSAARHAIPKSRLAARPYTLAHLLDDTFGRNASSAALARGAQESRLQRYLAQALGARLAVTKRTSSLAGGSLAMGTALAVVLVMQLVWNALFAAFAPGLSDPVTAFVERTITAIFGGNPIKLLALANLAPLQLFGATSAVPGTGQLQLTPPLSALVLIPMVALMLGGAFSAASDCTRRARYSVARGALVGPVYAALLSLLTAFGGVQLDGSAFGLGGVPTLIAAPALTLFYGLLWGTLFGALGGWVRLYGHRSLAEVIARLARISRFRRLLGAVVGAAYALAYGLGGSLALALAGLVALFASGNTPAWIVGAGQATHLAGTPQGILGLILLILTLAPALAIWLFVYACGGSLDVDYVTHATSGGTSINFATLALSGGSQTTSPALYLLTLLPLACCFFGGRVAARFSGAASRRAGFLTGALVALPLCVFMLILTTLATLSLQAHLPAGTLLADVVPTAMRSLPQLVLAAIVAGLGGRSAVRPAVTPEQGGASQPMQPLARGR